jgi:hypothetical protein
MKRDLLWVFAIIIFILTFSLTIYPTRYYLTNVGNDRMVIVRVDRFTGEIQFAYDKGWKKITEPNSFVK